jgi:hypothetical protein
MAGSENKNRQLIQAGGRLEPENMSVWNTSETQDLRLRVQLRSLREQLERNHFLLQRLNAASARLIQSLENGDAHEAIAEIIANLIGSEEVAIFDYCSTRQTFSLTWSWGMEPAALMPFTSGAGIFGRAAQQVTSQFAERQPAGLLLPHEKSLTACILLQSSREIFGVVAIFGLLPQKNGLEWVDYELLKFLETYAAVALQFQRLQRKQVAP